VSLVFFFWFQLKFFQAVIGVSIVDSSSLLSTSCFLLTLHSPERCPFHRGWNNIRMSMETVVVLAHAMGRTLVLPPEAVMYLLSDGLDFHDFFHLDALSKKHAGIDFISMSVSSDYLLS